MANEFVARNGIIAKDNSTITGTLAVSGNITTGGVIVATRTWVTGTALTGYATESYVTTAINNLIDSAPGALNTLNELAAALGDDPNFATTVTNSIATKVSKAGDTMTGNINWGTSDRGLTWAMNTDGAYIKFYNTGDGDTNSRLEYGTSDNGNEFHRWMVSTAEEMTLKSDGLRVTDSIWMGGNLVATQAWVTSQNYLTTVPDEYLTETEGDALYAPISHTHAATDITSGTLAAARLSGNYAINVTGSAATLTTARTLTIGNTGKTFNGSANVSWTLAEIGAQVAGSYLTTSVGATINVNAANGTALFTGSTGSWTNRGPAVNNAGALFSINTHPGNYYSQFWFDTAGGGFYHRVANNVLPTAVWQRVYADDYHPVADTWTTARIITIGSTGKSVNGSANVSWSLAEIGAQPAGSYLTEIPDEYLTETEGNALYQPIGSYLTAESDTLATVTGRGATTSTTLTLARVVTTGLYGPGTSGNIPIWQYNAGNPGYGIVYAEGSPDLLRIDVSGQALTGTPDFLIGPNYAQVNGNNVWHAGNDGSGSGLDADTVDGIQAASFLRSDANDSASGLYNFTSTSTSPTITVSGHAGAANYNYFLNASNDTGVKAVHFVNGSTRTADGGVNAYVIRNDGGTLILGKVDQNTKIYGNLFTYNDNTIWHAGNDGAGTGLDADLLDGQQGSYYLDWTNVTNKPDPVITLAGAVTGAATMTDLGNITITTTATSDPVLTLAGDATGSATFTNLGNATLTVTVVDDSHTHDGRYYTEAESDARFVNVTGDTVTGDLTVSGATLGVISTAAGSDAFYVDGVNGRLFTVTDSLDDSLFSVNTIAGLPVIEAFADNTVKLGPFTNPVTISSTGTLSIGGLQAATQSYVDTAITNLIGGAPGALDTLNELAAAINDDASYASTITSALALKAPLASPALTGTPTAPTAATATNSTQIATTAFVKAQGYSTTTGTVTSVSGAGSYGGLTLTGTVTSSGSLTLGGTPTGTWPISVSGNAATATSATSAATWTTARTITVGSTGKSVNGSANVSWTLAEIGAAPESHNHTSLTGVTSIAFAAQSSDSASITTTISSTSTFFDFNLTDDNNNDWWRWRFTPSGSTVYDAMTLKPLTNGNADLTVSGSIFADNFSGSSSGTNTGDQTTITGNAGSATVLQTARTLTVGATGKSFNGSANVSWSLAEIGAAAASHTHGISSITDSTRWWNNFGDNHSTRTAFDATTPSYGFGWRFVQGSTNGPGTSGTQFYSLYVGLGNDYPATGAGSYGMQLAIDRNVDNPYLSVRYNENNSLGSWRKIWAGRADFADSAGSATTATTATTTTGNAGSATILQTTRTINGTNFNGSANITTATWGTARTLTIGNTGKSVNGGANVAWTIAEIGALALTGGNLSGALSLPTGTNLLFAGGSDTNWRIGRNIITESSNNLTSNTIQFIAAAAAGQGWQFVGSTGITRFEIDASNGKMFFNGTEYDYVGGSVALRSNAEFNFLTRTNGAQNGRFGGIQVSTSYSGTVPSNGIRFSTDVTLQRTDAETLTFSGTSENAAFVPSDDRACDIGKETQRWRTVFCQTLDSAGLHETNLHQEGIADYETGTVLVWKNGEMVPCDTFADHMRMGIAVHGMNSPLMQGAEPVLCTGEIKEGQYLVSSEKIGHAIGVDRSYVVENHLFDCVIGKALESNSGESFVVKTWVNI